MDPKAFPASTSAGWGVVCGQPDLPVAQSHALVVPRTYAALRRAVEDVIIKGQRAAALAKVLTYHETGRLIREHLVMHKERADHGANLIPRLASDFDIDSSVLHRCVRFIECFPIVATWPQLTWAPADREDPG